MTTYTATKPVVTIRRPNGAIETVDVKGYHSIGDALFAKIKAATKAAGRGDVLSYDNVPVEVQMSDAQIADHARNLRLAAAEKEYNAHNSEVYKAMDHAANQ